METINYKNKNAVAILRVSSGRQKDGISHEVQETKCREYCEEKGFKLIKVFVITESAKRSESRKQYHEAMAFIKKQKHGNVLFYMQDREARNLKDVAENEECVLDGLFNIHYVSDRKIIHQDSPDADFLTRDFNAVMARHYSRNLTTRVSEAMTAKAETGWWPNSRPPLGYICQKAIDPLTGRVKNRGGTIAVDPNINNRKIVLREYELRSKGLSYEKIRETILEEGLITGKKAIQYRKNTIERRLNNPFYRGKFLWNEKLYDGNHEIFIPKEWLKKVDELSGQWGFTKRHFDSEYTVLTDGWLKCSCGCRVIYDPKEKKIKSTGETKTYHYYRCTNGKREHEKLVNIKNENIWAQFEPMLEKINISDDFAEAIADALNATEKKAHRATEAQIAEFKAREQELQGHEDKLFDLRLQGNVGQADFEKQLARIRSNREGLTDQLETLQKGLTSAVMETAKTVLELGKSAKSLWKDGAPEERRNLLDKLLSNPILDGLNIQFNLKKPFAVLVEMKENDKWCPRPDLNWHVR
ncbi:MAG: recombinase family protein [Pseudobdellovibrionaceae bacterium]|nr:MAG: recombinase family protein [Pseudobdellovibrionaceae bacterium]